MNTTQLEKTLGPEVKADLQAFLQNQPETWTDPQGRLLPSEKEKREAFAARYLADPVKNWLASRDLTAADLIDSDPSLNRWDFCRLIAGGDFWVAMEEQNHGQS